MALNLDKILRKVIVIMDKKVFPSVQEDVVHRTWVGQSLGGFGGPTVVEVVRQAFVEQKVQKIQLEDGTLVTTTAHLTFLQVITPNGAVGRVEPVDPNDRFVLADGTVGKAINLGGLRKGTPYLTEVWLQ